MQEQKPALTHSARLNESPYQKEGKSGSSAAAPELNPASMKVYASSCRTNGPTVILRVY